MKQIPIHYTLNHTEYHTFVDPRMALADLIREHHHLTGTKKGCEVGECGACTVLIDGKTYNSCICPAVWIDGKSVTTIEGLISTDGQLSVIQQAFVDEGAVQCGFCTPGMILSATALLQSGKQYTREEIRREISGNFCRCTGYENILNAIEQALRKKFQEGGGTKDT